MFVRHTECFTCNNLRGRVADAITVVVSCRLRRRRHAGTGLGSWSWPRGARERSKVAGWEWVWPIVRRSVRRGGTARGRVLQLPLGLVSCRRLRGWMARSLDQGVFAGVTTGCDGWVLRGTGCLGVTRRRGKWAGLFGWSRGLLLGAFRGKHTFWIFFMTLPMLKTRVGDYDSLTSADHVWTGPPRTSLWGSYSEMNRPIPLRRRGGHVLTGRAVKTPQLQVLTHLRAMWPQHSRIVCSTNAHA